MKQSKKEILEASGWISRSVEDFLGLEPEEIAYINLKIYLASFVQSQRKKQKYTQKALANIMGSSQSRVAKMESGDPSVSLDLMFKAFIYLGVSARELAMIIDSFEPPNHDGPSTLEILNGPPERDVLFSAWIEATKRAYQLVG